MGLDQYAFVTTNSIQELNSETCKRKNLSEIWYGRKINPLQGYFEDNYNLENCGFVEITAVILYELKLFALEDLDSMRTCLSKEEQDYLTNGKYEAEKHYEIDKKLKKANLKGTQFHLQPTIGLFYGNYEINSWYYIHLLEILEFCHVIKKELENLHQDERIVYSCWY